LTARYTNGIVPAVDGSELQRLRKSAGLTQAELAATLGVAPNSVARWERNERAIAEPTARLIRITLEPTESKRRRV
jgi:transcriptional regulator with XRE-family HTH domain